MQKKIKEYAALGGGLGMALGGMSMLKGGVKNVNPSSFIGGAVMGGVGGALAGASLGMAMHSLNKLSQTTPKKKGTILDKF